jgi:His-Xaa-Ser system protein HxsD
MVKHYHWRKKDNSVEILANTAIYPQEPLYATCCVFMDGYYIGLDLSKNKKRYKILLIPKDNLNKKIDFQKLAREFQNELINNVLRYKISLRNQKLREWIVKEALFFSQPKKEQERTVQELSKEQKREKVKDKIS